MIEDERYCVDIVVEIHAAINALPRVKDEIFAKHIENCVKDVFTGKSKTEISEKVDETMKAINAVHKLTGN